MQTYPTILDVPPWLPKAAGAIEVRDATIAEFRTVQYAQRVTIEYMALAAAMRATVQS